MAEPVRVTSSEDDEVAALRAELDRHRDGVRRAAEVCRQAARGHLESRVLHVEGDDDLADLHHGINQMLDLTDAFVREAGAALQHASEEKFYRRVVLRGLRGTFVRGARIINAATEAMAKKTEELAEAHQQRLRLADEFETAVQSIVETVASSSTELRATAETLAQTAATTTDRSHSVATASDHAAQNVQTVASAAEELSASAQEISKQVDESARIAKAAAEDAARANDTVGGLAEASKRIDSVVNMITAVANQTRLLALNATIEAARAGEAGRGFAVVASEVKNLASQTARATEDIGQQAAAIRAATSEAVSAIEAIGTTIHYMGEIFGAIDQGVTEQREAVQDISRSVHEAADATRGVTETIGEVSQSAEHTNSACSDTLVAAEELSRLAESLRREVARFLADVRG